MAHAHCLSNGVLSGSLATTSRRLEQVRSTGTSCNFMLTGKQAGFWLRLAGIEGIIWRKSNNRQDRLALGKKNGNWLCPLSDTPFCFGSLAHCVEYVESEHFFAPASYAAQQVAHLLAFGCVPDSCCVCL
jgi:hypothetical protein